jgi:transcriptional regulator with XRE-family HTH domain
MPAASISPAPARLSDGQWGQAQTIATVSSTPNVTAEKSRFRLARERRNLTQQQLADYCEIPLRSIKRYDAGGRVRDIEIAQRLAEVLDQPLHWLWPPDNHPYVQVARANHPDATPTALPASPDPREVLATLRTRPRRPPRARWLASVLAFVTAAGASTAVVLVTTGHGQPARPPTTAKNPHGTAPILTGAAPPLLAVQTTNDHRRQSTPATPAHASRHHRTSRSQRRPTHSGDGSSPAASSGVAQPVSTGKQPVASTTTASATTAASSAHVKRPPADAPSSGGGEFLP